MGIRTWFRERFTPTPKKSLVEEAGERIDGILAEVQKIAAEVPPPPHSPSPEQGKLIIWNLSRISREIVQVARFITENKERANRDEAPAWKALGERVSETRNELYAIIDPEEVKHVRDGERGDRGTAP